MNNYKIGIRDVIKELEINKNKVEFTNDLNIFLNVIAFNQSTKDYYDVVKEKFNEYMGKWDLDIDRSFPIISKYIKSRKLPYKIAKDEGFEQIKSEKFIISMLVELYAMSIIVENDEVSKDEIIKFIYSEFIKNGLNINEKDIILNDLDYLFKDLKLFCICREKMLSKKNEIEESLNKTVEAVEKRRNIRLNFNNKITMKRDNNENELEKEVIFNDDTYKEENYELKKKIEKLEKDIALNYIIISEYMDKEIELQKEISKLEKDNIELIGYGKEQYTKALEDIVRNMNDSTNGNLLDRLYCFSKGYEEKSLEFVVKNLFNVLRQIGISPRETVKIGKKVFIEEYSFYNYRLNKDISDIKLSEGEVIYPAWFYNNKEILKPYVTIKGE